MTACSRVPLCRAINCLIVYNGMLTREARKLIVAAGIGLMAGRARRNARRGNTVVVDAPALLGLPQRIIEPWNGAGLLANGGLCLLK